MLRRPACSEGPPPCRGGPHRPGRLTSVHAAAAGTTYQAESAALSGGAVVATDHSGLHRHRLRRRLHRREQGQARTTFTVSASAAGSDNVALRYANGTGSQTLSLYVNGTKIKQISLPATANWDTWTTETETVTLHSGTQHDRVQVRHHRLGQRQPRQHRPSPRRRAARRHVRGRVRRAVRRRGRRDRPRGYTGTGFVGGYTDGNKGNAATTFTRSSTAAGSDTVALRYANGTGATMTLSLYVNGTKLKQITLPATANWDTWGTETETVPLNAGSNTIAYKFDTTDSGNVNLDNIVVAAVTSPHRRRRTPPTAADRRARRPRPPSSPAARPSATSTTGYTGTGYVTGFTATGRPRHRHRERAGGRHLRRHRSLRQHHRLGQDDLAVRQRPQGRQISLPAGQRLADRRRRRSPCAPG